jgi:hypothetical protein
MNGPCARPLSFETLVAYWAGDLPAAETDAVDAHVMGCAECTRASERVAAVTEGMRATLSPFISAAELAALRARGLRIEENTIQPGQRTPLTFRADVDLLIHHLGGLDLSHVERVHIHVRNEDSGELISENPTVPFDAAAGEVLIACQRHFAALPPNIVFEVTAIEAGVSRPPARYLVPHRYEAAR